MSAARPPAFDDLLAPLVGRGYALAVTMLNDPMSAEDAVQEAAIKAWRKLPALRDRSAIEPWFLSIVANQCRSVLRGRWWSVLKLGSVDQRHDSDADQLLSSSRVDLWHAFQRLPHNQQLALILRYYLDLPLEQVAASLEVSVEAAKSTTHRGLRALRPLLGEDGT